MSKLGTNLDLCCVAVKGHRDQDNLQKGALGADLQF